MSKEGNITDQVAALAIIVILIATLGVASFNILANSSMVSNYTDTFNASSGFTNAGRIYFSNSELKTGTLHVSNSTFAAAVTTDYTVDTNAGILTIVTQTNGGRLNNGSTYTATYQKDSVSSTIKTLVITVIGIIGAIAFVVIIITRFKK